MQLTGWWTGNILQVREVKAPKLIAFSSSQISDMFPSQSRTLLPDFSDGPWTLVRLFPRGILLKDFDLDQILRDSGITMKTVPYIVKNENQRSYELVVAMPCLDLLSKIPRDFRLVVNYDPFEPAVEDIRIHGIWEAKNRARISTLNNAAEAIRNGWGYGPGECYRNVIGKAGLVIALEKAILNWDIQVTYLHIYPSIIRADNA